MPFGPGRIHIASESRSHPMIPDFASVVSGVCSQQFSLFKVLAVLATVAGLGQMIRRGTQLGQRTSLSLYMAAYSLLLSMVGAHLFEIIAYHPERLLHGGPRLVFAILVSPSGGISSVGGFLGCMLGMLLWSRHHHAKFLVQVDSMLFGFPTAWMFARLGCFSTHDHPGTLTRLPFGVDFGPGPSGGVRHDLGLYEAVWALVVALLFQLLFRRPRTLGLYAALATLFYAPVRFCLDFLRIGDRRYGGLTPAQYGMVLMFGLGTALLWHVQATLRLGDEPQAAQGVDKSEQLV